MIQSPNRTKVNAQEKLSGGSPGTPRTPPSLQALAQKTVTMTKKEKTRFVAYFSAFVEFNFSGNTDFSRRVVQSVRIRLAFVRFSSLESGRLACAYYEPRGGILYVLEDTEERKHHDLMHMRSRSHHSLATHILTSYDQCLSKSSLILSLLAASLTTSLSTCSTTMVHCHFLRSLFCLNTKQSKHVKLFFSYAHSRTSFLQKAETNSCLSVT